MKTDRSPLPRALTLLTALSIGALGCGVPDAAAARADAPVPRWGLSMAMLRARQAAPGYDFVADATGTLRSKAGGAAVTATNRGVRLSRDDFEIGVGTASVGRDAVRRARGVAGVHAEGQELVLARDGDVEESFLAGPLGVEQSFLVRTRPEGAGPLVVEVAFEGVVPERAAGDDHRVILRDEGGLVRGGYRDLAATDAEGHELAARMEVRGTVVALAIDDSTAAYPVLVDPTVWTQTAELVASDGAGDTLFGTSVALSGTTAILGAPACSGQWAAIGAAYVFSQSGDGWVQQAKLQASDGVACDQFGQSVALSGDTALVGAPGADSAYVFVRNGTTWTQQAKLTVSAESTFGWSVAVSGDTAVVGTWSGGGVYAFGRQGTTWTQQAQLGTDGADAGDGFGWSVGVDGATAIVGAYGAQVGSVSYQGAAYVFAQSGGAWTQQAVLAASDGKSGDNFGASVALGGGTAIVGAEKNVTANADQGAAYVFVQSGATWSQQAELHASNGTPLDLFGNNVALSGDTAVIAGFDAKAPAQALYVFARSGSTWGQQAELTANTAGSGNFGSALAIGSGVVLAGDSSYPVDGNLFQGDAYVFTLGSPPASTSSSSSSSSASSSGAGASVGAGGRGSSTSSSTSTGGSRAGSSSSGEGSSPSRSDASVVVHGWSCRAAGAPDEGGMGAWLAVLGLAAVLRRRAPRAR